ncbi:MAG: GNAT family N-acetyltransferase [Fibrobacter sp.]|nr:GNAT family N-acetyltransferase [Fibrobacter sp.]
MSGGDLKIVCESKATRDQWLTICKETPFATFFHTPMWPEIFSGRRVRPEGLILKFNDGTEVLFPCAVKSGPAKLFKVILSMPAATFGGWVSRSSLTPEHHKAILEYFRKFRDLILRENPYDPVLQKVDIDGSEEDFTQSVDLSEGYEAAFDRAGCNHRNAVRNAMRKGVTVKQAASQGDWDQYYSIYLSSIQRWKRGQKFTGVSYGPEVFNSIRDLPDENRKLWVAEIDGKIIAGILCFYWNSHAVVWHGAGLEEYFKYRASNLLYDHAIKQACLGKLRWLDCNPSGGISGVADFKDSLGALRLRSRIINRMSWIRRLRKVASHKSQVASKE